MKKILLGIFAFSHFCLWGDTDIVKETSSKPVLAAVVELSPFAEVSAKASVLGNTMNNPIVPTLLLSASQQALFNEYGQMRTDMPTFCAVYVQSPAYKVVATNGTDVDIEDIVQTVVVYPLAEKFNTYALRCPGSRKNPDGTLFVPATGNRKSNYTIAYSQNQKVAAFASDAKMARLALKDCERFYLNEKKKDNVPLIRFFIEKEGLAFLSELFKSSLNQKSEAAISEAVKRNELNTFNRLVELYDSIVISGDIDSLGIVFNGVAKKAKGSKILSCAGVRMPEAILNSVSSNAKMFYSLNVLSNMGVEQEDFRKQMEKIILVSLDSLKDSKNKNVSRFINKITPSLKEYSKNVALPAKNDYRTGWLGVDSRENPCFSEIETSGDYSSSVAFLEATAKTAKEVWPKYDILRKGDEEGRYFIDWNSLVDINGIEEGKPAPKELAVAKKKIKSIFGDSKSMLYVKKTPNGLLKFFGDPKTGLPSAKGDAESKLASALPETRKNRPTSVIYLMPYSIIRDMVLPAVAKSTPKAEREQYNMMIKAMVPAMPNSAIALAHWMENDGSDKILLRVTANELKSLGVIFNTFTASMLSGQGNEKGE
jgi:hypothetical protein